PRVRQDPWARRGPRRRRGRVRPQSVEACACERTLRGREVAQCTRRAHRNPRAGTVPLASRPRVDRTLCAAPERTRRECAGRSVLHGVPCSQEAPGGTPRPLRVAARTLHLGRTALLTDANAPIGGVAGEGPRATRLRHGP